MVSGAALEVDGTVVEAERGGLYRVEIAAGAFPRTVLAKRCGRLVTRHVRITEGDRVRVEISPYDTTRGRITRRL